MTIQRHELKQDIENDRINQSNNWGSGDPEKDKAAIVKAGPFTNTMTTPKYIEHLQTTWDNQAWEKEFRALQQGRRPGESYADASYRREEEQIAFVKKINASSYQKGQSDMAERCRDLIYFSVIDYDTRHLLVDRLNDLLTKLDENPSY